MYQLKMQKCRQYSMPVLIKGEKYSYFPEKDDHMMEYNTELIENVKKFIYKLN